MEQYKSNELPLYEDHKVVVVFKDDERYPVLFFCDRKKHSTIIQLENDEFYGKDGKLKSFEKISEVITEKITRYMLNELFGWHTKSLGNLDEKFALLQDVADNIADIVEESYDLIINNPNSFAGFDNGTNRYRWKD